MKKLLHKMQWVLVYMLSLSFSTLYAQSEHTSCQDTNWYNENLYEKIEFLIYPNPTSNLSEICLNLNSTSNSYKICFKLSCVNVSEDKSSIYISEISGRTIYQLPLKDCYRYGCIYKCYLDSLNISSGLYIVTFFYNQSAVSKKMILI